LITIALKAGWNHFVIRFKKTRAGFGGKFGTWLGKQPYYFLMPTQERDGQEGWIFTGPMSSELAILPGAGMTEKDTGLKWYPETSWELPRLRMGQLQRIYGLVPGGVAVGWTKALFLHPGIGEYSLTGRHSGPITVEIGDKEVYQAGASGRLDATIRVPFGQHDVMVKSCCQGTDWGFELGIQNGREAVSFSSPCSVVGTSQAWIYLGPFATSTRIDLARLRDLNKLSPGIGGDIYWQLDLPEAWVRIYNENPLYGRWNYPLGVTLYGLLHSAKAIGSTEIQQYVVDHIQY
jgi:hypothetical protein